MRVPGKRTLRKVINRFFQHGIVLMYHRVNELDCDPWHLSVSRNNFREQMQVLKKYAHPTRMQDMGDHLKIIFSMLNRSWKN